MSTSPPSPSTPSQDDHDWPNWRDISALDQLLLDNTDPTQPMTITVLLAFNDAPPFHWIQTVLAARLSLHPRFRATITRTPPLHTATFNPLPASSPAFPPANLVHLEPASDRSADTAVRTAAFRTRLNALASERLPTDRPLWALHYFPGYVHDAPTRVSGATAVLRVHHGLGDGLSLVKYCLLRVADKPLDGTSRMHLLAPRRERMRAAGDAGEGGGGGGGGGAGGEGEGEGERLIGGVPGEPPQGIRGLPRRAFMAVEDAVKVLLGTAVPDSRNLFNAPPLTQRKFAHFVPPSEIPLADVKGAAKRLGVTMNALLVAALTAAAREYLRRHDEDVAEGRFPKRFHTALAFNMHQMMTDEVTVNNLVTLLPLRLHIDQADSAERLRMAEQDGNRIKMGFMPQCALAAFKILDALPRSPRAYIWKHLTRRVSLVWTNVPGPTTKVQVDGRTIDSIAFAAPADGHGGVIFSFFSYAGSCSLCVSGDSARVSNPEELASLFLQELRRCIELPALDPGW